MPPLGLELDLTRLIVGADDGSWSGIDGEAKGRHLNFFFLDAACFPQCVDDRRLFVQKKVRIDVEVSWCDPVLVPSNLVRKLLLVLLSFIPAH